MWMNPIYHADAGFYLMSIHTRNVVDKVAMGQVNLRVLRFSPVNTTPTVLHTHLHLHVTFTRQTDDVWETAKSKVLSDLTFMGPCIVIYFYSKTNQMHNFSSLLNITLHVSDGLSVHHREYKSVHTASVHTYGTQVR
jgi:hypothetical protein